MKGQRQNNNNNNILDAKDQDRFLPIANVGRIMKKSLPLNAKISKEAKETVQECVSEFISFITGEASDKCQREKRKTVNGDDIMWSMTTLGFESYVGPLKAYLNKYRESEEGEKINCNVADDRDDHFHNIEEKDCFQFVSTSEDYDLEHQVIVGKSYEFEYGNGKKNSPLPAAAGNLHHGSSIEW